MTMDTKSLEDARAYSPPASQDEGTVRTKWQDAFWELKYMLTTRDGWMGDYVRFGLISGMYLG